MTSSREKVLELLASQRITPAEADTLLKALGTAKRPRTSLLDPLQLAPAWVGIALAAIPLALELFLERMGVHFNGPLDIHAGAGPASWSLAFVHVALGFPFLAGVLWLGSRIAKGTARLVDVLSTVGVARWPLALAGLAMLPLAKHPLQDVSQLRPSDVLILVVLTPLAVLAVAMLCLGVRTASGLRGARLAWTMVLSLAGATGLSLLLLAVL